MSAPLSEQQLAELLALLGDATAATDDLLFSVADQIRDRREHDHASAGPDWDWYCLNASGWLGDKAATVLRRLLDAEARVAELEQQLRTAPAAGLLDAAAIADNDDDCTCGGCDTCIPRALARQIRDRAYSVAQGGA